MGLSAADLERPVLKAKAGTRDGRAVLKYRNGVCPFLDVVTEKCKIYDDRPEVCRAFNCRDSRADGAFLRANPYVVAALREPCRRSTN
jgi:Fe-S-cluster containining protein